MGGIHIYDVVGSVGSLVIIGQYFLTLQGRISTTGLAYPLINLLAGGLLVYSLCYNFNLASMVIEIFWSVVSLYGIARYYRAKGRGVPAS